MRISLRIKFPMTRYSAPCDITGYLVNTDLSFLIAFLLSGRTVPNELQNGERRCFCFPLKHDSKCRLALFHPILPLRVRCNEMLDDQAIDVAWLSSFFAQPNNYRPCNEVVYCSSFLIRKHGYQFGKKPYGQCAAENRRPQT